MYRITIEKFGQDRQTEPGWLTMSQHIFPEISFFVGPGGWLALRGSQQMEKDFADTNETIGERAAKLIEKKGLADGQPMDDTEAIAAIIDSVITEKVVANVLAK